MSYDYSEDQLIQKSTADLLENELGWKSVYAFDKEVLGPIGTLGRNTRRGGCSTALWRICNPTQLNIRICNPQKIITELILGGLQILIITNAVLQIRHNGKGQPVRPPRCVE